MYMSRMLNAIKNSGRSTFLASRDILDIVSEMYSSSKIGVKTWYKFEMLSSLEFTLTWSLSPPLKFLDLKYIQIVDSNKENETIRNTRFVTLLSKALAVHPLSHSTFLQRTIDFLYIIYMFKCINANYKMMTIWWSSILL